MTAPRAVLVGNAAQTIHPIGAQGFNLGLRDALTLAELIEAARRSRRSGDAIRLRRRRPARALLAAASRGSRTHAWLSPTAWRGSPPTTRELLRPLRSLGLFAADRLPSAQAFLVGAAMGYRGDVPALCRESMTAGAA